MQSHSRVSVIGAWVLGGVYGVCVRMGLGVSFVSAVLFSWPSPQ